MNAPVTWIVFLLGVTILLVLDLKVFHRKDHTVGLKEAAVWSVFWIALSVLFGIGIWLTEGQNTGMEFFTGYVVEKALSVDNLFVFLVLLKYFSVPPELHHKVLFWGIVGAILIRGIFIIGGVWLIHLFEPLLLVLGVFLIYTACKLMTAKEQDHKAVNMVGKNPLVRFLSRHLPMTANYRGGAFFVRENSKMWFTPLFVALIAIETTDVIFALDSIPAIMGVTQNPFIVFSSNICAILGLRALFFLIENVIEKIRYLKYGLAASLGFIGVKMLLPDLTDFMFHMRVEIPILVSLSVVLGAIVVATIASFVKRRS